MLVIGVGRVQRYIAEARRTVDLANGSRLMSDLTNAVAGHLRSQQHDVVFPADGVLAAPNRVVAEVTVDVTAVAAAALLAAQQWWTARVHEVLGDEVIAGAVEMPPISWVAADGDSYEVRWSRAMEAFDARKRTRLFAGSSHRTRPGRLCSLTGRLPADDALSPDEPLSAEVVFKGRYGGERFPSTRSIAIATRVPPAQGYRYRRGVREDASLKDE